MSLKKYIPLNINKPYNRKLFMRDLLAGLTLFVMLVPQGMAYAMLAGLPPVMGLYASTLPLLVYALFASSRHLSVGPTAITSLLVFSGISALAKPGTSEYIAIVILLALMVGVFQLLFGVCKMGFIVKFISPSVLGGYTSAAAIIIGLSQLKHLLGIQLGTYFQVHLLLVDVVRGITELHWITFCIGGCSIIFLVVLRRINARIPAALLLILLSILCVYFFRLHDKGVQIVGLIPNGFPSLLFPTVSLGVAQQLVFPALTISLIGFMESLSIGKTIADKEKYKIHPNRELKALGLANMFGAFFQILPINGSFSRSAVNHQSGGVTQMVSIFTSLLIVITLLFFTSYFYYLPNAVLAAIIIVAVYKLIDVKQLQNLLKIKAVDGWSWLVTFLVTLCIGVQWGILIGSIFSYLLLLSRTSKPNMIEVGYLEKEKVFRDVKRFPHAQTRDDVLIVRIDSSIHFVNISHIEEKLKEFLVLKPHTKLMIIDFAGVNDMDAPSFESLANIIDVLNQEKNITLHFVGMKGSVRDTAIKAGWDSTYNNEIRYFSIEQVLEVKGIKIGASSNESMEPPFIYMI